MVAGNNNPGDEDVYGYRGRHLRPLADVRPKELAYHDAVVLLRRLSLDAIGITSLLGPDADRGGMPEAKRALLRWATDVPLNIRWYEDRLRWSRWYQDFGVLTVAGGGLVALASSADPLGLIGQLTKSASDSLSAGIVIALLMTVLQAIALLTDQRSRIGAFWKASADLQERLLMFEDLWRDKPILERITDRERRPSPAFLIALADESAKARAIAREERITFFSTMISPSQLLSIASQGLSTVRARRLEDGAAAKADAQLLKARADAASTQQSRLQAAVADLQAKQESLTKLSSSQATPSAVAQAAIGAESARLECERIRQSLDSLLMNSE